jgi:predicted phosphodiesterase
MIVFLGDIHGDMRGITRTVPFLNAEDVVIQVGDFGFDKRTATEWEPMPFSVYAIDGNHEDFRVVGHQTAVTEIAEGLHYVPRGTVLTIQGFTMAFLGGGASIDKAWREEGHTWFPQEEITDEDATKTIDAINAMGGVDILVTHTPGKRFINNWFTPLQLSQWNLPSDWVDHSARRVDQVLESCSIGLHICGHMHRSVYDGKTRCLNIAEPWVLPAS